MNSLDGFAHAARSAQVVSGLHKWLSSIALYARGLTEREIQGHLQEMYGVDVFPGQISTITDEEQEEVQSWQQRPLEKVYQIVYLDALVVKVRQEVRIANRSIYLVIGINLQGHKEVLGLWASRMKGRNLVSADVR